MASCSVMCICVMYVYKKRMPGDFTDSRHPCKHKIKLLTLNLSLAVYLLLMYFLPLMIIMPLAFLLTRCPAMLYAGALALSVLS